MLVYGDHQRQVAVTPYLTALVERSSAVAALPAGIERHAEVVAAFLGVTAIWQAAIDAAVTQTGYDEVAAVPAALEQAAVHVAAAVNRSWRGDCPDLSDLRPLLDLPLPATLTLREAEGYSHYALYPEQYCVAARVLPPGCVVVGLRSIGAGLAALVAAVSDAVLLLTLRPVGPPFARTLAVGSRLTALVEAVRERTFVIVDEGPGLSGSSFGGTADWLEAHGVARERIRFMPSHDGEPGPHASDADRARWVDAERHVASFEEVVLHGTTPLASWFKEWTGPLRAPPEDVAGGRWRDRSPWSDAPVDAGREVRKYRVEGERGTFLLRFVGLGDVGTAKFERARALFAGGFVPEPLALRHGFLLERWIDGWVPTRAEMLTVLPDYLRARTAFVTTQGASLAELLAMARQNLGEALGDGAAPLLAGWTDARVAALSDHVRPVAIDGRLHRWEWLVTAGGVVKCDAIDHARAHDLIGAQDIAWDVAGAATEFALSAAECDALIAAVMPGQSAAGELVAFCRLAYVAFQLGWWSYAPPAEGAAQVARYRDAAVALG